MSALRQSAGSPSAPADQTSSDAGPGRRLAGVFRWEVLLLGILVALILLGSSLSKVFLSGANFANLTSAVGEVAIMALPMTLVIVTGEIDLSVESMVGLSGAILGWLWAAGVPLQVGIPMVLVVGIVGGLLNGTMIARFGLPSLVVTLGTLALFRGLANVVLGPRAISDFPAWFTGFGFGNIPGTSIPWTLSVFAALAVVFWAVTHGTWLGRWVFAIGKNKDAARYSGIRVDRVKLALFVLSGFIAALAGVLLAARFSSARADNGTGLTLTVVTIVVLGGVDINGGKGTIPGVILAAAVLAVLQSALRLSGVSSEYQGVAVGLLLIVSVIAPQIARQIRSLVGRTGRGRRSPAGPIAPGEVVGS